MMLEGLRFVGGHPLLVTLAITVGLWQMAHHAAVVVQILFATRVLGLSERAVGTTATPPGPNWAASRARRCA